MICLQRSSTKWLYYTLKFDTLQETADGMPDHNWCAENFNEVFKAKQKLCKKPRWGGRQRDNLLFL